MIITIPTTCWEPQGGVEHPRMVSCTFRGYHKTHYLYLLLDDGAPQDAASGSPGDHPRQ